MLILYHVHHLHTEMEGKVIKMSLKCLKLLTKFLLQSYYRMSSIPVKILEFLSCSQNSDLYNMDEIEKRESMPPCGR